MEPGEGSRDADAKSLPSMLGTPSRFWNKLGAEHTADLELHGFEQAKRHLALRYFSWRWSWAAITRSRQMRFLLANTSPLTWLLCAMASADLSDQTWKGVEWPRRDRWLYTFAVRLLWEYASSHGNRDVLDLEEPQLGSPLPVHWRGRLVSQDLGNCALEAVAIKRAFVGRPAPRSILEVGAGYGRTAYSMLKLFPECTYTIVDIEPAIRLSKWYLSSLFPSERLRFLSPEQAFDLPASSIDLAVSISSLQEMTTDQVKGYLDLIDKVADGGVVYLKQWEKWTNPDDGIEMQFDQYPVPGRWIQRFRQSAAVQSNFQEAVWLIPGQPTREKENREDPTLGR